MIGYKALNENMNSTYGNMIYELNKEYEITGKLEIGNNGYHFCKELLSVYNYYSINSRVFKIDTLDGVIRNINDIYCSSKIKLIEELSSNDIKNHIENNFAKYKNNVSSKIMIAKLGYALNHLVKDSSALVRLYVAYHGYGLNILVNDEHFKVREEVAKHGYGLDKLIHDESYYVRAAVASVGYGLDELIQMSLTM